MHEIPPAEIKKAVVGTGARDEGASAVHAHAPAAPEERCRSRRMRRTAWRRRWRVCMASRALPTSRARSRTSRADDRPGHRDARRKELDRVEIMTAGGVAYELAIPLGATRRCRRPGERALLHTHLVVKEDGWQLFGFATHVRAARLPAGAGREGRRPGARARAAVGADRGAAGARIREKDIATLQSVPRVGRKKAEQLILDLADKLDELQASGRRRGGARPEGAGAEDAIRALVSLGYSTADAERAVRAALDARRTRAMARRGAHPRARWRKIRG